MSRLLPRAAAGDHLVVHLLYLGGRRYRSSKPAKSQRAAALVWMSAGDRHSRERIAVC
jgi:hypothetical protein